MAINPNIALQTKVTDLGQVGQSFLKGQQVRSNIDARDRQLNIAERRQSSQEDLTNAQIDQNKFKQMEARDQNRLKSTTIAAAEINPFLESGDIEGARAKLQQRRARLGERIAKGEDVDTTDTDEALQMLDQDPERLKQVTQGAIKLGNQLGFLKDPSLQGKSPSAVEEFKFFEGLEPAQQKTFKSLKRQNQGFFIDPTTGKAEAVEGFADIKGGIKEAEAAGKERGTLETRAELAPAINKAIESAKIVGKEEGIRIAELDERIATLPRLKVVVDKLSRLGKTATFTFTGRALEASRRELGLPVGQGAIDRKEYIAVVDNEILPLLRQTFGAQFTKDEGESLKITLGDPNASPAEKEAVLKAFISSKIGTIGTLEKSVGRDTSQPEETQDQVIDFNDLQD